jgi:hypothetical protein
VVEEQRNDEVEPERDSEVFPRPDETAWWEEQLGRPLPNALYTEASTGR